MKILLHYQGKLESGPMVNGQCFATVDRFCENDLKEVLAKLVTYLATGGTHVKGELTITFVTPLQSNEEGIGDDDSESINSILTNICGGDI
jgi:hypothetical protein